MVIITADDFGKTRHATDNILKCFFNQRITSASAMVFMEDSDRAAALVMKEDIEVGLHINFTTPFNSPKLSSQILKHHQRVASYLAKNKLTQLIYNPFLARSFQYLFLSQQDEFMRLYQKPPDFFNGHHHVHLCANMLLGGLLPKGKRVRRTFTFDAGEISILNRLYRKLLDVFVSGGYVSTDSFFSILPVVDQDRLWNIMNRSIRSNVEIEVHPENAEELEFLLSDQFRLLLNTFHVGTFQKITTRS
jgi:predicted glycoside hydrolase/deacetylase ChbG (UPF0249 family)